jgi:hypothetical protein
LRRYYFYEVIQNERLKKTKYFHTEVRNLTSEIRRKVSKKREKE